MFISGSKPSCRILSCHAISKNELQLYYLSDPELDLQAPDQTVRATWISIKVQEENSVLGRFSSFHKNRYNQYHMSSSSDQRLPANECPKPTISPNFPSKPFASGDRLASGCPWAKRTLSGLCLNNWHIPTICHLLANGRRMALAWCEFDGVEGRWHRMCLYVHHSGIK
ncbi:hypothetical protein ARMSODRAFT_55291 [Armillaria solidipes]|uniref:Uncharacterized protein n=1 Tax=Armillaria solidipes TaxID=1076256 RepID=A0A2H3C6W0_9AGAR|nr:hypothetical protein ARMSODRAFT_55291 [Armillaria solidipes]